MQRGLLVLSVVFSSAWALEPRDFECRDQAITIRLPDLERTKVRAGTSAYARLSQSATSAYARFLETPDGKQVRQIFTLVQDYLAQTASGAQFFPNLSALNVSVVFKAEDIRVLPRMQIAMGGVRAESFCTLTRDLWPSITAIPDVSLPTWRLGNARLEQHENLSVLGWAPDSAQAILQIERQVRPAPLMAPDADVEILIDVPGIAEPMRQAKRAAGVQQAVVPDSRIFLSARLSPRGIEEQARFEARSILVPIMPELERLAADPLRFAMFSDDTALAVVWRMDRQVTIGALNAIVNTVTRDTLKSLDNTLRRQGLPVVEDLLRALDGPGSFSLQDTPKGLGFSLDVGMDAEVASRIIAWVTSLAGSVQEDSTLTRLVGAPAQLMAYWRDGVLHVTLSPQGVEKSPSTRAFVTRPQIAATLAQFPQRALLYAVSDGSRSWPLITKALLRVSQTDIGKPNAALTFLPQEFQKVAQVGSLTMTAESDGSLVVSGGGLIGPVSGFLLSSGSGMILGAGPLLSAVMSTPAPTKEPEVPVVVPPVIP